MDLHKAVTLGRTGLKAGRLGIASGYWVPAEAIEMARLRRIGDHIYGRPRVA